MSEPEYTTGKNEYTSLYAANSVGEMIKVGEILTLGDTTQTNSNIKSNDVKPEVDSEHPTYGLNIYEKS